MEGHDVEVFARVGQEEFVLVLSYEKDGGLLMHFEQMART